MFAKWFVQDPKTGTWIRQFRQAMRHTPRTCAPDSEAAASRQFVTIAVCRIDVKESKPQPASISDLRANTEAVAIQFCRSYPPTTPATTAEWDCKENPLTLDTVSALTIGQVPGTIPRISS
jgi:hypothetical protein